MAKQTNPLDTEAAKPVNFSGANEAARAAKSDSDRITAEMNQRLSAAIARTEDLSSALVGVVNLVGMILPLVTRVTPAEGPAHIASMNTALADLKSLAGRLIGNCNG